MYEVKKLLHIRVALIILVIVTVTLHHDSFYFMDIYLIRDEIYFF